MTTTTRRAVMAGTALAAAGAPLLPLAASAAADPVPPLWLRWQAAHAARAAADDAVEGGSGQNRRVGCYQDPVYEAEGRNPIWMHGGDTSEIEAYWAQRLARVDAIPPGILARIRASSRARVEEERDADLERARAFYARWEAAARDVGLFDAKAAASAAEAEVARVQQLLEAAEPTSASGAVAKLQFALAIEGGDEATGRHHDAVRQVVAFLGDAPAEA